MPLDVRARAEGGGHWVRSLRKDCGWLQRQLIDHIVEAVRGKTLVPDEGDVTDFCTFDYTAGWACLLLDENYPRRMLAEALLTVRGVSEQKVCELLGHHCGFRIEEMQVSVFRGAAYILDDVDWQAYLASLPPIEQEAKALAREASAETVVAYLNRSCCLDGPFDFSNSYRDLAVLTAHRLQKAILAGDGRSVDHLSHALVRLEQRSKATGIRSRS
jgi:hypothetical protein